jgi:conjugal transfer/entry exclusion protein
MTPELILRAAAARYLDITRHGTGVDDMTDEQESEWQVTRATLERALHTDSAMTRSSRDTRATLLSAAEVAEGLRTALLDAVASAEAMRDVLRSMAEPAEQPAPDGTDRS